MCHRRKLAESGDGLEGAVNQGEQLVEAANFLHGPRLLQQHAMSLLQGDPLETALMGIALVPAVFRERRFFDCGLKARVGGQTSPVRPALSAGCG
jgi:hypothetical protein